MTTVLSCTYYTFDSLHEMHNCTLKKIEVVRSTVLNLSCHKNVLLEATSYNDGGQLVLLNFFFS